MITFEERFFKHQVINIESSREARMIVTKTDITTFLKWQELLHLLLDTGGYVLVNVDQSHHTRTAEGERKILNRSAHWKPSVRIFIIWL